MLNNKWLIDREAIESQLENPLTEEQWAEIAEEIEGRVDNFIEEILDDVIDNALKSE